MDYELQEIRTTKLRVRDPDTGKKYGLQINRDLTGAHLTKETYQKIADFIFRKEIFLVPEGSLYKEYPLFLVLEWLTLE